MISYGRTAAGRVLGVLLLWTGLLTLAQFGPDGSPASSPAASPRTAIAAARDAGVFAASECEPAILSAVRDARPFFPAAESPDEPTAVDQRESERAADTSSSHVAACLAPAGHARETASLAVLARRDEDHRSAYWTTIDRRDPRGPPPTRPC